VNADYGMTNKLGENVFRVVHWAPELATARAVAIEPMDPLLVRDGEFRERLCAEVTVQAMLVHLVCCHPPVLRARASARHRNEVRGGYAASRWQQGHTLTALLAAAGGEDRVVAVFRHARRSCFRTRASVVRSDIKPPNIPITGFGLVTADAWSPYRAR
jgi:hypothetical protein